MRKFSRREKRIFKLLASVILIALILEVDARFRKAKADLVLDIENQQSLLDTYLDKLQSATTVDGYNTKTTAITTELEQFRELVLELPRESDATLLIKETIDDKAKELGMSISSISSRKSKPLVKDQPLKELKTYFAFDSNLENMLEFFDVISHQGYFMVIESMNLGTRRRISTRGRRKKPKSAQRPPLNGNAVLTTLFVVNSEASLDAYLNGSKSSRSQPASETPTDKVAEAPAPKKTTTPIQTASNKPKPEKPQPTKTLQLISELNQTTQPEAESFKDPQVKHKVVPPKNERKNLSSNQGLRPSPRPLTATARRQKKPF